jgi:hypothetical protein
MNKTNKKTTSYTYKIISPPDVKVEENIKKNTASPPPHAHRNK